MIDAQQGTAAVAGRVQATGSAGSGGSIAIVGVQTGLFDGARVDASGMAGGGTILVGGDIHGTPITDGSLTFSNSLRTYVAPTASLRADAIDAGDGGKVVLWSNEYTGFYGSIAARGGAKSGNGGFVETSSKHNLQALGMVDAAAPYGAAGRWLLDPNDITIQTAGADTSVAASPGFTTTNDSAIVTTGSIVTALNAGTSVTVTTASAGTNAQAGNITVANAISKTAGGNATLTLNASNDITFSAGADVASTAGTLGLTLNATGAINSLQNVGLNGGTLTLNATGNVTQAAGTAIQGATGVVTSGAGTVAFSNANSYTGATSVNAGTLTLGGANGAATGSAFTVNAGATLKLDNSGSNNNNRLGDALALTMNGGEFVVTGNAGTNTSESIGALTLNSGYSTITLTPDAAKNTQVTFASLSRSAGATALFRGINLGANTVASQTANNSNIVFTAAPALTGGGGNSGTRTVSIIGGAIGAGGAAGNTSAGTDFVTYNPPTGAVNGLRPLLAGEYTSTPANNANVKLTANRTSDDDVGINSLLLSGGINYDYNQSSGA